MVRDRSSPVRNVGRHIGRRIALSIGLVTALALFAFFVADGASYLADAPEACLHCHVMEPQHASWQASSHAIVAVCNDCHTPRDSLDKAMTKARSGLAHAWAWSTGRYPDPIRIAPASAAIALDACRRCHGAQVESMGHGGVAREGRDCLDCHWSAGHADSRSTF
jgi:cytochrome c nitrite reductase small subunit